MRALLGNWETRRDFAGEVDGDLEKLGKRV